MQRDGSCLFAGVLLMQTHPRWWYWCADSLPCIHSASLRVCTFCFVSFRNPIDQIAIMFSSGMRTARDARENADYTKIQNHLAHKNSRITMFYQRAVNLFNAKFDGIRTHTHRARVRGNRLVGLTNWTKTSCTICLCLCLLSSCFIATTSFSSLSIIPLKMICRPKPEIFGSTIVQLQWNVVPGIGYEARHYAPLRCCQSFGMNA